MQVSVIGAAGRVGLPFSLVLADKGHTVIGIDKKKKSCDDLNLGKIPFIESGATALIQQFIPIDQTKKLFFTTDTTSIATSDAIVVMIGTPVDGEGNPR